MLPMRKSVLSVQLPCPARLCDPMDCSTPGFPVITYSRSLLKLMFIKSVMPSNHLILSSPSPPAFYFFQHQGLFQWVSSSHQVAKVRASASASALPMNIQDCFLLGLIGLILQSKGLSRDFSNNTVQKHQFFGAQFSLWSNLTSIHDY